MDSLNLLPALTIPLEDDMWKVRDASLQGFVRAAKRLNLSQEEISSRMSQLDLTCTEFNPSFPIRRTYNRLAGDAEQSESGVSS